MVKKTFLNKCKKVTRFDWNNSGFKRGHFTDAEKEWIFKDVILSSENFLFADDESGYDVVELWSKKNDTWKDDKITRITKEGDYLVISLGDELKYVYIYFIPKMKGCSRKAPARPVKRTASRTTKRVVRKIRR